MITREEAKTLAEEVFKKSYCGDPYAKELFMCGFEEAYNALSAIFYDRMSLVAKMREAQNNSAYKYITYCNNIEELRKLESEVDEYLKKMEV